MMRTLLLLAIAGWVPASFAADSIAVRTQDILPLGVPGGAGFEVGPDARVAGGRATFMLRSEVGAESITGTQRLYQRIDEIHALDTLRAMERTDVYTDAVKNSALGPFRFARDAVTSPIDTIGGAARGIGGLFKDIGYSIASDDPDDAGAARTALGFSVAKRSFAYELGVSPYTDYAPLEERLGEVAWTAVGGSLTVSAGMRAVQDAPGRALSISKTANGARALVRDLSPRELADRNEAALTQLGMADDLVQAFVEHADYDPEMETRVVEALVVMEGVARLDRFLERVVLVGSRVDAHLMVDWAEVLAAYHGSMQPVLEIVNLDAAPLPRVSETEVVGLVPADYIALDRGLAERHSAAIAQLRAAGYTPGAFVVAGGVAPGAVEPMRRAGWADVQADMRGELFAE